MAFLTPAPQNFMQPIRSAIAEAFGLGWLDIEPVLLHFRVTLDSSNGAAGNKDIFRVPQGRTFLGYEMRGHVGMNNIGTEPLSSTTTSVMALASVRNRILQKAMNARVTLKHLDCDKMEIVQTDVDNNVGNGVTLPLAAIMFGKVVKWCRGNDVAPMIVPEDKRLQCNVTLADVAAVGGGTAANGYSAAGLSTEYGVTLAGALVRSSAT